MSDTPDTAVTPSPTLTALKINLGLTTTAYDERLTELLAASAAAIRAAGAQTLDETNPLDAQLLIMYASWQWNSRDTQAGMPRMLQLALNNRVFGEKMREAAT